MPSIEELFDKLVPQKPKKTAKKIPTGSKPADPLKAAVTKAVRQEKLKEREKKGYQSGNGYDYVKVWNEDSSDYKYVPKARYIMGKLLGREVAEHERVFFRDRGAKGEAKYAPENLILGFKAGVPLDFLTCKACGARGNWEVRSASNEEQRDSAE